MFHGHLVFVYTQKNMLLALWCQHNGLPCHVIAAKKFQSGYWSPAHMAALSNRCFSFMLLQSLSSEAQSQRGDSWCEPFPCYSGQTQTVLRVKMARILLWKIFVRTDIRSDGLHCYDVKKRSMVGFFFLSTNHLGLLSRSSHCLHMICAVIEPTFICFKTKFGLIFNVLHDWIH